MFSGSPALKMRQSKLRVAQWPFGAAKMNRPPPCAPKNAKLGATHVGASARVDLDGFAFLDEKRDADCFAGL